MSQNIPCNHWCIVILQPQFLAETRREAAVWSSKLLPFTSFLPRDPDIEDLVLSVLSELPCDTFLADMLAFCFPSPSAERKRAADTKLKRIITRLRAGGPQSAESAEPLSVKYQLLSKLVLANRARVFGNDSGGLHEEFLSSTANGDTTFKHEDLSVGDLVFEYDLEYLDFLSTLFTIIIPPSFQQISIPTLPGTDDSGYSVLPYLSEFHSNNVEAFSSSTPFACTLYPLLNSLIKWAQMPYPQKVQEVPGSAKKVSSRKMARRRSTLSPSIMRVNLSIPVIIGCLREREESLPGGVEKGWRDENATALSPSTTHRESTPHGSGTTAPPDGDIAGDKQRQYHVRFTLQNQTTQSPEGSLDNSGQENATDMQQSRKDQPTYTVTQNIVIGGKHHQEGGQREGGQRSIVTDVVRVGGAGKKTTVEVVQHSAVPREKIKELQGAVSTPEDSAKTKGGRKLQGAESTQEATADSEAKEGRRKEKSMQESIVSRSPKSVHHSTDPQGKQKKARPDTRGDRSDKTRKREAVKEAGEFQLLQVPEGTLKVRERNFKVSFSLSLASVASPTLLI